MDIAQQRYACKQSLLFFCLTTLPQHFYLPPADFHSELAELLQNPEEEKLGIIGFRGSAKTTYTSLATPLWAGLNNHYNFIVIIAANMNEARSIIGNIKYEIENNKYIKRLYPNAIADKEDWTKSQLTLSNGTKIVGMSRGQKIRGMKYKQYRPDFVLLDDIEDRDAVRTKSKRDETERWFSEEVIPAIDEINNIKLLVIGNKVHRDCLLEKIRKEKDKSGFKIVEYPLIEKDNGRGLSKVERCTWTAKYPTEEAIQKKKNEVGEIGFQREYLLKIVSDSDQVVKKNDIVYYNNKRLTTPKKKYRIEPISGGIAADLAISKTQNSDFTAMVAGLMAREDDQEVIYILPNVINEKLDFNETVKTARAFYDTIPRGSKIFVEDVAYQKSAIQEMKRQASLPVQGVRPIRDKRARLETAAMYIKQGKVRFPKKGCEELVEQLLGFGVEEHDDMVDALVYLILGLMNKKQSVVGIGRGDSI